MAVVLTGTEYIDLDAHATAFSFTPQPVSFSIAFETVSTGVEFLFSHDRGGDAEIGFYHNNGTLNVRYTTTGGSLADLNLGGGFNDGTLHRVLAVWTGGTLQGWVDGVMVDSTSTGNMPASTDANMNIGGADGGLLFVGELSECAVWSTALSAGDAADLTDGTSAVDGVTGTLEGWWPLDFDARDASGNGNDGSPVNDPAFTEQPPGVSVEAQPGTAHPAGQPATLTMGHRLDAHAGIATPSGQPVSLTLGHQLDVTPGTALPSGQSAALTLGHRLDAQPGTAAVAGQSATFTLQAAEVAVNGLSGVAVPAGQVASFDGLVPAETTTPASRIFPVHAEDRTFSVRAEDREFVVAAESRRFAVT